LKEIALSYLRSGLCVLPAFQKEKRPALTSWKEYQERLPNEAEIERWFGRSRPMCILTGTISGHLEMIDFDLEGELFDRWRELVLAKMPELLDRLVIERSQSGGRHVVYRCETAVNGNLKLAQRIIPAPDDKPITIVGKQYRPRKVGDHFEATVTLIETRGEGGLFLCHPTTGYELEQGQFQHLPILTEAERLVLLEAAWSLNESKPVLEAATDGVGESRPGDDFNERGDLRGLLARHGWTCVRGGDNEHWRRPGKESGWSATLRDRVFYVFSSNAAPFDPNRAYSPFAVYALLEHAGDYAQAASVLRGAGYGATDAESSDVDLSHLVGKCQAGSPSKEPEYPDPGELPLAYYRVPGFISEVMDHCLETAPYPNLPLAFCGALALQAVLAGRKVRDQADNRTNLYILALAFSSVGKDWPRKVNAAVLYRAGLIGAFGEKFSSGEGIQDALNKTPSMLFQTDEIDGLLLSINKSQDARYENILGTLLTMYSSANSIFPMRRKAGKDAPEIIDQPSLVVYGTAIPTHYYKALSERMLTNGFFARMLIVEAGKRQEGREPGIIKPPARVMEAANWWAKYCPGSGNLEPFHPEPRIVEATTAARQLLTDARKASEAEYSAAESKNDPVGTTVWGRVPEQIRKLALLYAVSESHESPLIDVAAAHWATDFILHQTRRMLFMAHNHVAENPFHAECLKLLQKLRDATDHKLPHSVLLKRMKVDSKTFHEIIKTLQQQQDLTDFTETTGGRPQRVYQLLEKPTNGQG
jgi:hypothetical protein